MRPRNVFDRRHPRTAGHVQSCTVCAAALRRERQYIQRLRESPVPPASEDLAARLLARTELLAAAPEPNPGPHRLLKAMALTAGGTAAAAGILAVTAFALAGEGSTVAGPAMSGSLVQHTARPPTGGGELSEVQLSALRAGGWVCAGLEPLGFHVMSAKTMTVSGLPAVEMRLSDGQHYATVVEQHPEAGHPAAVGEEEGQMVVSSLAPWTATYRTAAGSFSVESDLPAGQAEQVLPLLQGLSERAARGISTGSAAGQAFAPEDSPTARLERGLGKIAEILTP